MPLSSGSRIQLGKEGPILYFKEMSERCEHYCFHLVSCSARHRLLVDLIRVLLLNVFTRFGRFFYSRASLNYYSEIEAWAEKRNQERIGAISSPFPLSFSIVIFAESFHRSYSRSERPRASTAAPSDRCQGTI